MLENKVVKLEFQQGTVTQQISTIERNSHENAARIADIHLVSTKAHSKLDVLIERIGHVLDNHDKLEIKVENNYSTAEIRMGGNEDAMSALSKEVAHISGKREVEKSIAGKSSDRRWSMVTLVPYALCTALVSASVAYAFNELKVENEAIKKTQLDEMKKQLDELLKGKEDDLNNPPSS